MQLELDSNVDENWDFSPHDVSRLRWYEEDAAPPGVPVLDLGALRGSHGPSGQADALRLLRQSVTQSGFFYLKNHRLTDADIETIANRTRAFFSLPEEEKKRFDHHRQTRGYTG